MTIALLSHTYKQGNSGGSGTSSAIDTTGASLLVAYVADFTGSSPATFADSQGNTWTALTARPLTGNMRSQMYYCASPSTSASHTFSATGTNSFAAIAIAAYSGTATSPYDQETGATTLTGTSLATGSVTPSENNELVIYGCGYASSALSVSVGTMLDTAAIIGGTSYGIGLAYEIQTTATARSPSWSWSSSNSCSTTIATFKADNGVSGTLATTNANDTSSAAGTTTIVGTLASTNANDTSAASGTTTVIGTVAATNADDTSAASGTVGSSGTTGTVAYTNADDTAAATGTTTVTGTVARSNADDSVSASGWVGAITGTLNVTNANDTASASGTAAGGVQTGGGGYLPSFRRKTRKEIHAERVRLGILPEQIRKAAQKVVEKAAEQGDPQEVYEDNTERYRAMFLREVGATKWAPDYARAIRIQLELMERDAEDALLLM